ncbi:MAG: DUF4974 domain-containing protein [Planctomycetaceae bacterium]
MRRTIALAAGSFLLGLGLARGGESQVTLAEELFQRQEFILKDLRKVEAAARDIAEVRATREAGIYVLTPEEKRLEAKGRENFHIFMERCRNNTLEALRILDTALGDRAPDALRAIFGKALEEVVSVEFEDSSLDEVTWYLEKGYGIKIGVKGDAESRLTMSLHGDMSLQAILDYVEQTFGVKLVVEEGRPWFVPAR